MLRPPPPRQAAPRRVTRVTRVGRPLPRPPLARRPRPPRALPPSLAADVLTRLAGVDPAAAAELAADAAAFEAALASLGRLLGGGDEGVRVALTAARSQPALLLMPRGELCARLVSLRAGLPPSADAAAVARLGPRLLLQRDPGAVAAGALARLAALMPGASVDVLASRLGDGGTTFLSFADTAQGLIRDGRGK